MADDYVRSVQLSIRFGVVLPPNAPTFEGPGIKEFPVEFEGVVNLGLHEVSSDPQIRDYAWPLHKSETSSTYEIRRFRLGPRGEWPGTPREDFRAAMEGPRDGPIALVVAGSVEIGYRPVPVSTGQFRITEFRRFRHHVNQPGYENFFLTTHYTVRRYSVTFTPVLVHKDSIREWIARYHGEGVAGGVSIGFFPH